MQELSAIERTAILGVFGVAQVDPAEAGISEAVAAGAGRHHAIEHVEATPHGFDHIVGRADPHQIARLCRRQMRHDGFDHLEHDLLRLTDREPADGETMKIHAGERARTGDAQFRHRPALHDAEHRASRFVVEGLAAAFGPAQRKPHGALRIGLRTRQFHAFVELHPDVAAEQRLDLHCPLGCQHMHGPVDMRLEGDAVLVEPPQFGERHDLVAAGIGEDRMRANS